MDMRLTIAAVAVAVLLAGGPSAAAEETGITVRGTGRVEAVPDMATLNLGVSSEAGTAQEAMARNSDAMAAVLARLREGGIAERDLQTSGLRLSPRYEPRPAQTAPRVTGYVAQNLVTVRIRELDRIGAVLDAAVADGANTIHGLSFGVAEPQALEDEARREAVAAALRQAETLAEAAGVGLGGVRAMIEEGGGGRPVMMEARMAAADAVPIAEGEVTVEASVRMVFDIAE